MHFMRNPLNFKTNLLNNFVYVILTALASDLFGYTGIYSVYTVYIIHCYFIYWIGNFKMTPSTEKQEKNEKEPVFLEKLAPVTFYHLHGEVILQKIICKYVFYIYIIVY